MGGLISKIIKYSPEPKTVTVNGNISEDPRSPSEGVHRTPIAVEKHYLETDIDELTPTLPLRVKLLRKSTDPRSPTVGINRTPISLLQTSAKNEFDSPVSLYSNYQTDIDSYACIPSPAEPSVNVSDFAEEFASELDELVNELSKSWSETPVVEEIAPLQLRKEPLNVETKKMCEGLIQEIIDSFKEYEDEIKNGKPKASSGTKKLSLSSVPSEKVNKSQLSLKKNRKPLSNITSAGNTPTKFTPNKYNIRKEDKLVKVEMSGENSPVANVKVRAQWDHDSTIII